MILTLSYPKADAMRVVMAQSFRVFVLVAVLPAVIVGSDTHGLGLPPQVDPLSPEMLALLAAAGLAAGYVFNRAGVPAGWLTGPFFLSAIVNAAGWMQVEMPQWLSLPALVGLGCVIGCRFTNLSPREFARMIGVSLGAFIVGMSIATAISGLIWAFFGLPFGQLLLAFAPGGAGGDDAARLPAQSGPGLRCRSSARTLCRHGAAAATDHAAVARAAGKTELRKGGTFLSCFPGSSGARCLPFPCKRGIDEFIAPGRHRSGRSR